MNTGRACPQCGAQPGQPCRRPNGDRYITLVGTPKFHAKREAHLAGRLAAAEEENDG